MRRPALACAALGVPALALLTEAATGPGEQRPAEPLVETIVHTTLRPPNWDLYLFEKPGGPPRRLTDDPALDYNAVFSPDGRWIVFTSEREGGADLWALDLQGSGASARLTRHHAMDDAAAFSPDGRRLAFVSTREGNADIFVMPFAPSDVTAEERAANLTRRPGGDINPAFSPDGRSIAFSRQDELWEPRERFAQVRHNYGVQLYVMDADGSNVRRLSEAGPGPEMPGFRLGRASGSPAWSLDGRTLFYYQIGANLRAEIRRVGADGSRDTPVVPDGLSPALRPDTASCGRCR
jgi:Tol biopolymer transport system component